MTTFAVCAEHTQCQSRITGKERDSESGNDYFGARYYASTMGRFLSPDWSAKIMPVPYAKLDNPQTLNLYAYVLNNPLSRTDPTGHYEAGCANDVKKCADQIQKLDKQLQAALKSKDPNIVKAAQAYGKLGDKNGVNVTFMNVVDPKNANVTGTTSAQAGNGLCLPIRVRHFDLPQNVHDLLRCVLLRLTHPWLLLFQFLSGQLVQNLPGTPLHCAAGGFILGATCGIPEPGQPAACAAGIFTGGSLFAGGAALGYGAY